MCLCTKWLHQWGKMQQIILKRKEPVEVPWGSDYDIFPLRFLFNWEETVADPGQERESLGYGMTYSGLQL